MLRSIENEQQYDFVLQRVYELLQKNIEPDTKESNELEVLSILVKEYENEFHPIIKSSSIDGSIMNESNEHF